MKESLLSFYGLKKNKKKSYGKNMIKNIKKIFNADRPEDLKQLKSQWDAWGDKNIKECQNCMESIEIRTLTIIHKLLALGTRKNEEGEKIHKEEIA